MSKQVNVKPIESKLTQRFAIITAIIYLVLASSVYYFVSQRLESDFQTRLRDQAEHLSQYVNDNVYQVDVNVLETVLDGSADQKLVLHWSTFPEDELDQISRRKDSYQILKEVPNINGYLEVIHDGASLHHQLNLLMSVLLILGILIIGSFSFLLYFSLERLSGVLGRINHMFQMVLGQSRQQKIALTPSSHIVDIKQLLDDAEEVRTVFEEHNSKQIRFISDVSHELRTPVSVIKGYMAMLLRWGKEDEIVLEESLRASLSETSKMEIMINDMLDMIRIKGNLEGHEDDLTIIEESVESVISNFKVLHSDFNFQVVMEEILPLAKIYNIHFEQLLVILIDNAVKYTLDKKEILVTASLKNQKIELVVKDYGRGIHEDDVKHIFDRFYRTNESRNRQESSAGVGIGLSILKQIVEAYQIDISVKSVLGQGTEFILLIPAEDIELEDTIS